MAHYATVANVSPLQVLEDGADTPVAAGKNLAYAPALNDRVVVTLIDLDDNGAKLVWIIGEDG